MKILLIIVGGIVLLKGAVLLYQYYFFQWRAREQMRQKFEVIKPMLDKLNAKQIIAATEVLEMAQNPSHRNAVFRMLEDFDMEALFPAEYLTREKGAESHMVNWLEFPTELGRAPDEIALIQTVLYNAEAKLEYFVFRFSSLRPQWAARSGWMIGVSGPYAQRTEPFDAPLRVFSRFNRLGSVTAEQEVEWVHENINPGG